MKNEALWKLVNKLWEDGQDNSKFVNLCLDYWDGKVAAHQRNKLFQKTGTNVIQPIVETKLRALLDADFTFAVVPKIKSFQDLQSIKDNQAIADILNDELHNIFIENNMTTIKELVCRYGYQCGFGVSQVSWDINEDVKGKIRISHIQSDNLRWDSNAKSLENMTYIGYQIKLSPAVLKSRYCKNPDGSFDLDKCKKIDNLANRFTSIDKAVPDGVGSNVISYSDTRNDNTGMAYVGDKVSGIKQNKYIELVCMFLLDDSLYAPQENDSDDTKEMKETGILKYPYGRMILFSVDKSSRIILEDLALDESFKNLGNIDIFNPVQWNGIEGKGVIEGLMSIQDRINGMYNNYIRALKNHFSTMIVPKESGIDANSLVKFPVLTISNMQELANVQVFTNNGIAEAKEILEGINQLQQYAYQASRVNETMLYGQRQTGTTSAEQVAALQENPMADIRGNQANFTSWIVQVGEKCINLIKNKYSVDRLIKLSTNMDNAKFAQISETEEGKIITLYNETAQEIRKLKFGEDLDFYVEVVAGTEIPRTRKEQSVLVDNMIANGIFEKIKDLDLLEMYLKMQDIPNYRAIMQIFRKKQEQANAIPPDYSWTNMFQMPELAKEFSNLFDKLGGYSLAKQAMLEKVGLPSSPGKLDNTPVTDITSQSEVSEVVTMAPNIISDNPGQIVAGHQAAKADQLIQTLK